MKQDLKIKNAKKRTLLIYKGYSNTCIIIIQFGDNRSIIRLQKWLF